MALNSERRSEWIPLFSQQLRLRNLNQILAYNVRGTSASTVGNARPLFYYTLHLTSKSAPFYSSEPCTGPNPRWADIDLRLYKSTNLSGTGLVVRIWQCDSPDKLITVWGLHLSGLVPIDPQIDLKTELGTNSLVFFLHGYPFMSPSSSRCATRLVKSEVSENSSRNSYTVKQLLRLHHVQIYIAHHAAIAESIKQNIRSQGPFPPTTVQSGLLGTPSQRYKVHQLLAKREEARHRQWLLREERAQQATTVAYLQQFAKRLENECHELSRSIAQKNEEQRKKVERLKEAKKVNSQTRELLLYTNTKLINRRRQLISQLKFIYPIQKKQGVMSICDVALVSSDVLESQEESSSSVALGFAAHATVMVATFLDVPLRYPIVPAGSRGRILDLITHKINEREFPLFSRGRDKLLFKYAVYLLNQDISQLKWYCGISTRELQATLANLQDLFNLKTSVTTQHQRSSSASSHELVPTHLAASVKSHPNDSASEEQKPDAAETSHTTAVKEISNSEDLHLKDGNQLNLPSSSESSMPQKMTGSTESWDFLEPVVPKEKFLDKEQVLSCSLDHGLDTLKEPKLIRQTLNLLSSSKATNSSEPNLNSKIKDILHNEDNIEDVKIVKPTMSEVSVFSNENNSINLLSPVKTRTYSVPYSIPVIEEFHDCVTLPNVDSTTSSCSMAEAATSGSENSNGTLSDGHLPEGTSTNESLKQCDSKNERLTKLDSIDNLFAAVASRTEALANRSGSFNLVKSRATTLEGS